jgi:ribosomal-protein-alanine N-acetyltransferase
MALTRPYSQWQTGAVPPTLRTARLLLTPVEQADLAALHAHWNDPRVGRWLWDGNPVAAEVVARLVERSTHTFQEAGWGLWALRPAAGAPLIGLCGLCPFDHGPGVELLYSLAPTHWSRGLATEAATAVLAHAFDTLGLPEVLATTDDGNDASLRVLHRLGATPLPGSRSAPRPTPASASVRSPARSPGMLPPEPL